MNALLSPHRMPIHQPDITYRTRFAAYSARDTAFIYMETPCTNDKTDKQRIHNIRFQPGSTALMHIPDPLPCNDIFGNRSDSMPCVLYLLEAKRPIVQIEHRYIGIGHCNRPGCIQRKMFRQAVHSLSHIVPACTHGITVTAVATGAATKNQSRHGVHTMSVPEKQYPVCQLSTVLRVSSLA
mgnify:FL=1